MYTSVGCMRTTETPIHGTWPLAAGNLQKKLHSSNLGSDRLVVANCNLGPSNNIHVLLTCITGKVMPHRHRATNVPKLCDDVRSRQCRNGHTSSPAKTHRRTLERTAGFRCQPNSSHCASGLWYSSIFYSLQHECPVADVPNSTIGIELLVHSLLATDTKVGGEL